MKNKLNFFEKIMTAITFAEADEEKTAIEVLTNDKAVVYYDSKEGNSDNINSNKLVHTAD